jgi:sulfur-oxidizing protein SoxX
MRTSVRIVSTAVSVATLLGSLLVAPTVSVAADESVVAEGNKIAYDRRKGNCLACHVAGDGELPGNIGPPLVAMKARFPDKAKLRAQIWDPQVANPNTSMPPYGRNLILTDEEIDKVVEWVYTL